MNACEDIGVMAGLVSEPVDLEVLMQPFCRC